jgi:hypothetical protein
MTFKDWADLITAIANLVTMIFLIKIIHLIAKHG